jgi:hypothetical protein
MGLVADLKVVSIRLPLKPNWTVDSARPSGVSSDNGGTSSCNNNNNNKPMWPMPISVHL